MDIYIAISTFEIGTLISKFELVYFGPLGLFDKYAGPACPSDRFIFFSLAFSLAILAVPKNNDWFVRLESTSPPTSTNPRPISSPFSLKITHSYFLKKKKKKECRPELTIDPGPISTQSSSAHVEEIEHSQTRNHWGRE